MNIPLNTLIEAVEAMGMATSASSRALTHQEYMRLMKAWVALKVATDEIVDAQKVEVEA